jgi:hypothetical protein
MNNEKIEIPGVQIQRITLVMAVTNDDGEKLDAGEWLFNILDSVQRGVDMKYAAKSFLSHIISAPHTEDLELRKTDGI